MGGLQNESCDLFVSCHHHRTLRVAKHNRKHILLLWESNAVLLKVKKRIMKI